MQPTDQYEENILRSFQRDYKGSLKRLVLLVERDVLAVRPCFSTQNVMDQD